MANAGQCSPYYTTLCQEKPALHESLRVGREGADLIVMGALGRSMVEEALVGSISRYVVRHAHCPVLVVK